MSTTYHIKSGDKPWGPEYDSPTLKQLIPQLAKFGLMYKAQLNNGFHAVCDKNGGTVWLSVFDGYVVGFDRYGFNCASADNLTCVLENCGYKVVSEHDEGILELIFPDLTEGQVT